MLGQSALVRGSAAAAEQRTFVYEVTGLHQNTETENQQHQVRSSSSIFIQVPYRRMNEEMRRISRLGGKIVAIHTESSKPNKSAAPAPEAAAE
ncbi:MAG TPA: phycobilisome linker polypeptide [Stenomitos sp.]